MSRVLSCLLALLVALAFWLVISFIWDLADGGLNDVCAVWVTTDDQQRFCVEWSS